MRYSSSLVLLLFCIFAFQQTSALRRIKRGSTGAQNKTKLSNDILSDQHMISGEHPITAPERPQEAKGHSEHAWAKKAVAAVEHVIGNAIASFSHKPNEDKPKKSTHSNTGVLKSEDGSVAGKDLRKPSLAYLLNSGGFGERFFDDIQHGGAFGGGEGAAEVLIIDNGMQPMLGMQHGLNSIAFHQPNLRSIANSFKRMSEINKESKLYNPKPLKISTDHSNNNAVSNNIVGKLSNDNGINKGTAYQEDGVLKNNERNDNRSNSSGSENENAATDSHKRNNDHVIASIEDNGKEKHNGTSNSHSNNNVVTIGGQSHHTSSLQQHNRNLQQLQQLQQPEVKESLPTLLSFSHKPMDGIGSEQSQGLPQEMKHHSERAEVENSPSMRHKAQTPSDAQQQQVQVIKHSNGKVSPMESLLKFANMMLYRMGSDASPIHAQGAQLSVNGNPTTSVISIGPAVEGAEDAEAIDFLYNSVDPQLNLLPNPGSLVAPPSLLSTSNTALLSRPFVLPPYSLAGPVQPISFMENAMDLLLNAEDEGNDEVELVCPIHHPKKKSNENAGDGKDKDGVIQVCSCRFFKKNKNH